MTEPSAAARELIRLWRIKVGSFAIPERDYHDSEDYEQLAQDIVRTIAEQVAQAIARALAEKDAALALLEADLAAMRRALEEMLFSSGRCCWCGTYNRGFHAHDCRVRKLAASRSNG